MFGLNLLLRLGGGNDYGVNREGYLHLTHEISCMLSFHEASINEEFLLKTTNLQHERTKRQSLYRIVLRNRFLKPSTNNTPVVPLQWGF